MVSLPRIRVLIVDDHAIVREGVGALLAGTADLELVGETGDPRGALELAERLRPDVAVIDLSMPGLSGVDLIGLLRGRVPATRCVVFSMHDSRGLVEAALRAGARGYVLKGRAVGHLMDAIRAVHRGEPYLSAEISELVLQGFLNASEPAPDPLTVREREVLSLVTEGLTSRQVAARLGIKPKTVENHRTRIMDKLGIHTTAGLVRYALSKERLD